MSYDVEMIRSHFPGLARMEGDSPAVFFDNPAGTQVARLVVERMAKTMIETNANLGGVFTTTRLAMEGVAAAHRAAADFVNAASPDEVFFGQNMTTITFALSRAIGRDLSPGDEIVVTRMDHDANISPWLMMAQDRGLTIRWLEFNTDTCEFDLASLEPLLNERTRLVAVGYASNLTGTINDVPAIARLAKKVGALVYVDAVQYAPHGLIDVQALGCDFLVCSAYKFFGPHYGMAWGRPEVLRRLSAYKVRPASDDMPWKFVTGTTNREELAGCAAAIDYYAWVGETFGQPADDSRRARIAAGVAAMNAHDHAMTSRLIKGLQALPGIRIYGITDMAAMDRRVPTISFRAEAASPAEITQFMADNGVYVWAGHNYAIEPCRAFGILESGGVVRVGLAHYNTMAEVEKFLALLESFLASRS